MTDEQRKLQRYNENKQRVISLLETLTVAVEAESETITWGMVGSYNHLADVLEDAARFWGVYPYPHLCEDANEYVPTALDQHDAKLDALYLEDYETSGGDY